MCYNNAGYMHVQVALFSFFKKRRQQHMEQTKTSKTKTKKVAVFLKWGHGTIGQNP